ncbi:unnamed protein product [Linum tenue]|uniref:Uncharacterized protein n=1 Tax=Linum tenue TaxID=586396 RepID=A0AAV0QJI7_9ROSI|nr:unnamed protein product [Linum tenue]
MTCTIDSYYCDGGFGNKTFKRGAEPTAATGKDNGESMEVKSSLPRPAKRSMVPSVDDGDRPNFGLPTYDEVIAERVSGWNWKCFSQRLLCSTVVSKRATSIEERPNQLKRGERAQEGEGRTDSAIWVDLWIEPTDKYGSRMETCQRRSFPIDDATWNIQWVFYDRFIELGLEDKTFFSGVVMMSP